jgi:hypothetical protein
MQIVIGNIGSDAGYWVLDANGLHHVGGWGVDSQAETYSAISMLAKMPQLKTPGLAKDASQALLAFVEKEISANVKEASGGIVVVVAQG